MSDQKLNYTMIIVAVIGSIGVGEGIDFGQDYSEEIAEAEQDRQIIKEELGILWEESEYNYYDIDYLYTIMCEDGYQKACDYWYGE